MLKFNKHFGKVAIDNNYLEENQFREILETQREEKNGKSVEQIALDLGYLSEEQINQVVQKVKNENMHRSNPGNRLPAGKSSLVNRLFPTFSRSQQEKASADIWKKIAEYPFSQVSYETGLQFVLSLFSEIIFRPAYFLYLINETGDKLKLEYSFLAFEKDVEENFQFSEKDAPSKLRKPELTIHIKNNHKEFTSVAEWAGNFMNFPLMVQGEKFIGTVLAGPHGNVDLENYELALAQELSVASASSIIDLKGMQQQQEKLQALDARSAVSRRMLGSALETNKFVSLLLDLALTATKTEAGFIAIADEKSMTIRAKKNLPQDFVDALNLSAEDGLFEWSPHAGEIMVLRDLDFVKNFNIKSIIGVPLEVKDRLIGIFTLLNFESSEPLVEFSVKILRKFVEQIKLVLNNSRLFDQFTDQYLETIKAMSTAYDVRTPYTAGHSRRVSDTAVEIARHLNLPDDQIEDLRLAGLIHDVGMCGIVDIEGGFQADFNHPIIGANMIELLPISSDIVEGVRTHHEWMDGWGFPQGLKGDQIPMSGRILAVADYFVESTSNNKMHKAMTWNKLIEEFKLRSGSQFDEKIVAAFYQLFAEKQRNAQIGRLEPCWKFKGEIDDICSQCQAYKQENKFCWTFLSVQCYQHGDSSCEDCFIYKEWLERIKHINQIYKNNKGGIMDYTVMEKNGITLINLQGQIDVTVAPKLRDLIRDLIEKGHIKIAINMKKVDFIDSSGLGIFVIAFKLINEKGGVIKLINMNDQVKQLFKVTKLLQHFEIVKQQ